MGVSITFPFRTRFLIMQPSYEMVNGVSKRTLEKTGEIFASARSFGGTEKVVDGVLGIVKTMVLQTWYRPDLVSGTVLEDTNGNRWEMYGEPENIEMSNRFIQMKVKRVDGDR